MKKRILIAVIVLALCLLCGCGGAAKSPTDAMLKADLTASLKEYAPVQELAAFEVETSLTQDNEYTASVLVETSNDFSEASFRADIKYTKYDQGWQMDHCSWALSDYTVTDYPAAEYLTQLVKTEPEDAAATPSRSEFFTQQTCTSVTPVGDGSIMCSGFAIGDSNKYAAEQHEFSSQWSYDPLVTGWTCTSYEWGIDVVFEDLSGSWPSVHAPGETITISNFTPDGFDVRCSALKTSTVHVEKVYNPQWPTYSATGASGIAFNGDKITNGDVIVRFSISENRILVSYILGKNIDEAAIS